MAIRKRPPNGGRPSSRSILARQQDSVVDKIQGDLRQREVRIFDCLGEHDAAVAVFAGQCRGVIGIDREIPALKLLGPACLGDIFHAVRVMSRAIA